MEYVMSFLIGLNESFAQVRGQLVLIDLIPPINKVFSLISQEEHQRSVNASTNISSSTDSMAFYSKADPKMTDTGQLHKKKRCICTYCDYIGHAMDKCYKLHGYPPRYRDGNMTDQTQGNVGDFIQTLNPA
ncbi:uncharacterized protein LOC111405055 [Olea europaea var. sylvestris]|uniref:uncharacterized protein LOC111405055 n=1 Tax=Olea europaea var. sylvestris TaxID=158386 RepID=UPI000C1D09A2|nr:uncharacterized protein LOC111405055 [Olea europaea var. sylvestris]